MPSENPAPEPLITLEPEVHRAVLEAAAADGVSVSEWMTAAAHHALVARDRAAAAAASVAEHGRLTAAERSAARRRIAASAADHLTT